MAKGNFDALLQKLNFAISAAGAAGYTSYIPKNHRGTSCCVDGCPNLAYAKGMCNAHYIRSRKGKCLSAQLKNGLSDNKCRECGDPISGKGGWGLCQKHYRSARKEIIKSICIDHLGGKCRACGEQYPHYVYDFHHIDPSHKEASISLLFQNGSVDDIATEVSKCELLCANCHRIRHHG